MSDDVTLLPCPFCGATPTGFQFGQYDLTDGYHVCCTGAKNCALFYSTPYRVWDSPIEAITAWNTRTPSPDSGERMRDLVKPFVAHWQPWMGDREYHKDDDEMSCFARVTFGQLRDLRAALQESAR